MENLTVSQVTKIFDVTPRMLRHYEKLGLIKTVHRENYAYRLYDESTLLRLQQIIILRKLRIPLKQIALILQDTSQHEFLAFLQAHLAELDNEAQALDLIRRVLTCLEEHLRESLHHQTRFDLLEDSVVAEMTRVLSFPKNTLKESVNMEELNKAEETLNKSLNVRILMVPSGTVASCHYVGENPEEAVGEMMTKFVQESRLYEKKPDARMYGFNHPNPGVLENGIHGYEDWVTIPDDMEVAPPMVKKQFPGGMYAVLTIPFPEFHLWESLTRWVNESKDFEPVYHELGEEVMGGCLEEHLNWVYAAHNGWKEDGLPGQIDLMLPVKMREK